MSQGLGGQIRRLFKSIRSLAGPGAPAPDPRIAEFFSQLDTTLPSSELRRQIHAFHDATHAAFNEGDQQFFYQGVIKRLPRLAENHNSLNWAYERLIQLPWARGDRVAAMALFDRYVDDYAPAYGELFDRSYRAAMIATQTRPITLQRRDRFQALVGLLQKVLPLQGLVAECGCYRGLSSYMICSYLQAADAGFDGGGYRIFDSFAGLSEPQPEDAIDMSMSGAKRLARMTKPGAFAASLPLVQQHLSDFPGIAYYPGWIPQAFPDEPEARYRFVHVDVDIYQPTRDCFEYFYPRLVPGGILLSDDYAWPGARRAIEEFCARTGAQLHTTACAQAYVIAG